MKVPYRDFSSSMLRVLAPESALRRCVFCTAGIGAVVIILASVLGFKCLPDIIESQIFNSVKVTTSPQYVLWQHLPFPLSLNVFVFNVTNPEGILKGEKPRVEQVGPFVYKEYREKQDIKFSETFEPYQYKDVKSFFFDEIASAPLTNKTEVVMLNVAKYGVYLTIEETPVPEIANLGVDSIFPDSANDLFHRIKVKDMLFDGYFFCDDNKVTGLLKMLCFTAKAQAEEIPMMEVLSDKIKFSYFSFKNYSHDQQFEVLTDAKKSKDLNKILKYNGKEYLDVWDGKNSTCNKVTGTDPSMFPPFIQKEDVIEVFSADICRKARMEYFQEVDYDEVKTLRYMMRRGTFGNNEESCYCINQTRVLDGSKSCLPEGFLDLKNCLKTPVIASYPHLLWADEEYAETVEGLDPDENEHCTFVDLEPTTGVPLRGAQRIQFNVILRPINGIALTEQLKPSMLPLIWVEETMTLPDNITNKLKNSLHRIESLDTIKWGIMAVGGVFLLIALTGICCGYIQRMAILRAHKR